MRKTQVNFLSALESLFKIRFAWGQQSPTVTNLVRVAKRIVVLFLALPLLSTASFSQSIIESDSLILVELYNETNGDQWTNSTGWLTATRAVTWFGVTIDPITKVVTMLELSFNNLSGPLPLSIGNLHSPTVLDFSRNQLTGPIPESLGNLNSLESLDLGFNQFDGSIPSSLGNLNNLQELALNTNQLSGTIPESLGNLINLLFLILNTNQFSGAIPNTLGNLTSLEHLNLSGNQLTEGIPVTINNLESLQYLNLSNNQLAGINNLNFDNLPELRTVALGSNQFTGTIPPSLANLENVITIDLINNQLQGSVPNLSSARFLFIRNNQLSELPDLTGGQLQQLSVQNNKFAFDDLEPNRDITVFNYSPQDSVETILEPMANEVRLSVQVGGSATTYRWFRDDVEISEATDDELLVDAADSGEFRCVASNSLLPSLTLYSRPVRIMLVPSIAVFPQRIVFRNVQSGESDTVQVKVFSSGTSSLEIQNIAVEPMAVFSLENIPQIPLTLDPGDSVQFNVRYAPSSPSKRGHTGHILRDDDGAVTLVSNAPGQFTTIPIDLQTLAIKGEAAEDIIKAGDFIAIEGSVIDVTTGLPASGFVGTLRFKVVEELETIGIGRVNPIASLADDGVAQPVFFFTPQEPFSDDRPITPLTVLSGRAKIEVSLEDYDIEPDTVEVEVRSPLDFFIKRIEIQQGIIDADKDTTLAYQSTENKEFLALPFIAEHPAIARVIVGYGNTAVPPVHFSSIEGIAGISAELTLKRGDEVVGSVGDFPFSGYMFRDLDADGLAEPEDYPLADQRDLKDALTVSIQPGMLKMPGMYTFECKLRFGFNLDEIRSEKANNDAAVTKQFVGTNSLRLLTMVGALTGEGNFPNVDEHVWDFLKFVYPIQDSKLEFTDPDLRSYNATDPSFGKLLAILDRYNKEKPDDQREKIVLFTVSSSLIQMLCRQAAGGCANALGGRAAIIGPTNQVGIAHELGHTLGLRDTYKNPNLITRDGPPNPRRPDATDGGNYIEDGNINLLQSKKTINAIDPANSNRFNPYFEFMGGTDWVDRITWDYLYQSKFRIDEASQFLATAAADSFIAISGVIDTNNTVSLNPFITMSQVPEISAAQEGLYALEFMDNAGSLLSNFTFDLEFNIPDVGDVEMISFSFNLPLPQMTATVALMKEGTELAGRTFSENPPEVEIISPAPGEMLANISTISWSATDPDGDDLTYDVLYSPDGQEQIVVDVNIQETAYQWDASLVPKSTTASITVIANDGVNEARATSENLVVSVSSPDGETQIPTEFALHQNYPNPFNPITEIRFDLPASSDIDITIFNLHGQKVRVLSDRAIGPGQHSTEWDGKNELGQIVSSGVYIYRIRAGNFSQSRKMIFLR